MNIKAIVTGEQDIKKLGDSIETVSKKTKGLEKSMGGVSAKSVALGNIYAKMASVALDAFSSMWSAGKDYQEQLDEMNGKTNELNKTNDELASSFGALSATITQNTVVTGAWDTAVKELSFTMDWWNGFFSDKSVEQIKKQREELVNYTEDMLVWADAKKKMAEGAKVYAKELANEARQTDIATQALARYNGELATKERAHQRDIAVTLELINIYEEQGRSTDGLINQLDELEAKRVNHTKTIREEAEELAKNTLEVENNTEATKESTDATHADTEARSNNTKAMEDNNSSTGAGTTFQSDGKKIDGATAYALHSGMISYGQATGDYGQAGKYDKYFEEIARNTRQTNQYLGGI